MGVNSKIEWCDATWNPVTGCSHAGSPGCDHCYARELHQMRHCAHQAGKRMPAQYAKPFHEIQLFPERLAVPQRWSKPRTIFIDSMGDVFHRDVPDEFIDLVMDTIWATPRHTYIALTKRVERMVRYIEERASAKQFGWVPRERTPMEFGELIHLDDFYFRNMCGWNTDTDCKCEEFCGYPPAKDSETCEHGNRVCMASNCPIAYCNPPRDVLEKNDLGGLYTYDEDGYSIDCNWMELHTRPRNAACGNLILGFSASDQKTYEEGMREFRRLRGILGPWATLIISLEPLLGPIDFTMKYHGKGKGDHDWSPFEKVDFSDGCGMLAAPVLNGVIAGGETGSGARQAHPDWFRGVRDQCQAAGVAFFFKGFGGATKRPKSHENMLDGREWKQMPERHRK